MSPGKLLKAFMLTVAIFLFSASLLGGDSDFSRRVYVGVYQNKPKIFLDDNGEPSGLFIDLLEQIAKKEKWELKYISGSWPECLQNLAENKINLMPDVAYSEERDELFDFHSIPVLESWSRIYSSKESVIEDLTDLEGKKVAILDKSIQEDVFNQLMEGLGYEVEIIPVSSLTEAFEYARDGLVDAAIANHLFGEYYYLNYELEKTTIDFN
ncbi:MAG: transporter substrate-binding domain-containing protein, partial [Petrotogales bacterium]